MRLRKQLQCSSTIQNEVPSLCLDFDKTCFLFKETWGWGWGVRVTAMENHKDLFSCPILFSSLFYCRLFTLHSEQGGGVVKRKGKVNPSTVHSTQCPKTKTRMSLVTFGLPWWTSRKGSEFFVIIFKIAERLSERDYRSGLMNITLVQLEIFLLFGWTIIR